MAKLKEFQMASSNRIMEYFDDDNNHRYLLADEVGLGKTIIASDVIHRFVEKNKREGKDSVVYYVCGNLALIAQNEKKLCDGYEKYRSYQQSESRDADLSRLVLSFIRQNYLDGFDELIKILKAVAVWMLAQDDRKNFNKGKFYCKDGRTPRKQFIKKLPLISDTYSYDYKRKLQKKDALYLLLLDIYEKIKEKELSAVDKENIKSNIEKLKIELKDEGVIEHLVSIYDNLAQTKKILFQSLTPRTSIEKNSNGTWIERTAAGIVYYKWIKAQKNKQSEQKVLVPENDELFDEQIDNFIRGQKEEFKKVLYVIKHGNYEMVEHFYFKTLLPEWSRDAQMALFLYENITEDDVKEITKGMKYKDTQEVNAEELMKDIMDSMATYSLRKAKQNKKVLVVVDEFQNYSSLLGTEKEKEKISEECIKIKDELLHSKPEDKDSYVLLLSATPFHFANANVGKETAFRSELLQINSEVDLVLKYVLDDENYRCWLNAPDATGKYNILYENGVSRTERDDGCVEDGFMALSYENDRVLLEDDIKMIVPMTNYNIAEEVRWGDIIIYYEQLFYICREDMDESKVEYYFAPDDVSDDIKMKFFDLFETIYDDECEKKNKEILFFQCCGVEEYGAGFYGMEYEWIEKTGDYEKKLLKRLNECSLPISYIKDTPWLLSFASDYKKIKLTSNWETLILNKEQLMNYAENKTCHARFRKLRKLLLEEREAYKLLYIPPSRPDYKLWGIYENFDNSSENPVFYSKSLIFSQNYHTPRAFAAMLSYESERLNRENAKAAGYHGMSQYDERAGYDLRGKKRGSEYQNEREVKESNRKLIEEEIKRYRELKDRSSINPYRVCISKPDMKPHENIFILGSLAGYFIDLADECKDEYYGDDELESLLLSVYSVFTTKEAHDILSTIDGATYMDKIHAYSAQGNFRSVLDEYVHLILEEEHISLKNVTRDQLYKTLRMDYFTVIENFMRGYGIKVSVADNKDMYLYPNFAQGITGEEGKAESQLALKNRLTCFNSPFRPFVFTTTSVGAEGLDFHWFCRNIYHWALEMNPEKFQQKEGRINRFHSHCVRQNLARDFKGIGWDEIYEKASESKNSSNPLWPEWSYEGNDKNKKYAKLTRNTCYYPGSYEDHAYKDMIRNMEIYRKIIKGKYLCPYDKRIKEADSNSSY